MSTYAPEARPYRRFHVNPWLVAVLVLAAGLVALGTLTVVDRYSGSQPQATQIIDELNSAVNSGDDAALRRLFAKDAVFVMPDGTELSGLENVVSTALIPHGVGLQLERVAPVSSEGNFATTFIGYGDPSPGNAGVEMVVIELRDGKILRQWVYDHG